MKARTILNEVREKKEAEKKQEQEVVFKVLKRAFTNVTSDPDGLIVMRYIMDESGWLGNLIVGDPTTGDIHDNATLYNNARRLLYKQLRKFIPVRALKKIEFDKTNFKGEIEDE